MTEIPGCKPANESNAAIARLWTTTIDATFEADTAEDAEAIAKRLAGRVLEHPAVWGVEGDFDPDQKIEVVDV